VEDELNLAHDLQQKLMPDPAVLGSRAQLGVRSVPAASVGGDFYTFLRLGGGRVGVMLGDVSSHGLSAALVMALVLSAAAIHMAAEQEPGETLRLLQESLATRLTSTEMFVSVFYGVIDPSAGRLAYANAGHPFAYRFPGRGDGHRLDATAPPLGLDMDSAIGQAEIPWSAGADLLALWTDGLTEAANDAGERFGEAALVERLVALRARPPAELVAAVFDEVAGFAPRQEDDRTLLALRL